MTSSDDKLKQWKDVLLAYTLPNGDSLSVTLSLWNPSDPAAKKGISFSLNTDGLREQLSYPIKRQGDLFISPFQSHYDLPDELDFIKTQIEVNFLGVNGLYTKARKITEEKTVREKLLGRVPNDRLDDLISLVVYDGLSIPDVLDIYDRFQSYNPMYYQD